jgi:tripartite-type tricarboxylate transporter receptor subunit TctC
VWPGEDACTDHRQTRLIRSQGLVASELRARYFEQGVELRDWAGEKFDAFYKAQIVRWAKVAKHAGIAPD